ncbi:MAG TPA: PAS domain-containing protein, partial [Telluria sp.]
MNGATMRLLSALLPRSLVGRIFAVFSLTMLIFMGTGLGLFYRFQFLQHIEDTQDAAQSLVEVATETIEDSVVIGDYDTVQRTLNKMLFQSPFKRAEFIDVSGAVLRVQAPPVTRAPAPDWLVALIAAKLYDVNRIANVGGKDYGVVRLSFDERKLAAQLWTLIVETASLAAVVFVVALGLMRILLRRWLANLGRLRSFENEVVAGRITAEAALYADAPIEIQEAIRAVNRSAASLRVQYGQRIDSLMNSLMQRKSAIDQAAIVCELDTLGRITGVNQLFVENSGFAREELLGLPLAEVGGAAVSDAAWTPDGTVWKGEVVVAGRHGMRQWYRTVVPMFDAAGVIERYICIDIDISERKEFERALVENARRQTLIADLGRKALGDIDLDELFLDAVHAAARGLGTACAALFELGPARQLTLRAGAGRLAEAQGLQLGCPADPLASPSGAPAHGARLRPWFAP